MDKKKQFSVRCDECGCVWNLETWISIDEAEDIEAIQMIEDGIYFDHFCPECGKEYSFVTPTVYFDKEQRFMLCFIEGALDIAQTQHFLNELTSSLGVEKTNISIRIATSCNEFREKIILHRNKLDDRVVELMKLMALEIVRAEGWMQKFDETRCSVDASDNIHFDFCGKKPRHLTLIRGKYEQFAQQALEVLNQEPTPLEINSDWAIEFATKHGITE